MKYISANQRRLIQNEKAIASNEAHRLKKLTTKLVMLSPTIEPQVLEFWSMREHMMSLSLKIEGKLREHFLLRIGDVNPLRKIIK